MRRPTCTAWKRLRGRLFHASYAAKRRCGRNHVATVYVTESGTWHWHVRSMSGAQSGLARNVSDAKAKASVVLRVGLRVPRKR